MFRNAFIVVVLAAVLPLIAADSAPATRPATKPVLKIIPGKLIVPTDNMRRPWGELISLDLATRTGKFRRDGTDEVMSFVVMPYAELLHHAAFGDLKDFRIGERAIFRLHPNEAGEWVWLTYIQDEMNMMNGHKEYFFVDSVDPAKGQLVVTQANQDKSFVREKGIVIETDAETRYWKAGQPAKLADIKPGNALRTKTHGTGKGKSRVAWEVFLDDESLLKFQSDHKAVHAVRMQKDGAPGYVDEVNGEQVTLTLFQEGSDYVAKLAKGNNIFVAPAGVDRKPTALAIGGAVVSVTRTGKLCKVVLKSSAPTDGLKVAGVARLWIAK